MISISQRKHQTTVSSNRRRYRKSHIKFVRATINIKRKNKPRKRRYSRLKRPRILDKQIIICSVFFLLFIGIIAWNIFGKRDEPERVVVTESVSDDELDIKKEFIPVNPYSRPGIKIDKINGVVVHYTANPGADAMSNRDYFSNLRYTHTTKASSHYIVDLDGTIVQCIPLTEMAYASNNRNSDTIAIECCHKKKNGQFTKKTYEALVKLVVMLCKKYKLKANDVIRHYDVTGKICPKYFVEHEDEWKKFLLRVSKQLNRKQQ